jgi:hypothetical protein
MSAVNPTRLQSQIRELLTNFDSPQTFHTRLSNLFSLYANRTLHYGESSQTNRIALIYHSPPPLTRQLQIDLIPYVKKKPQVALEIADQLWEDPYLEIKNLAVFVLGKTPISQPEIITERLNSWLSPGLDKELITKILSISAILLEEKFPSEWEKFIQTFLNSSDPKMASIGIRGIIESIKRSDFKNSPMVHRLISPFIQNPQSEHMEDLENLLKTLINHAPIETAYFIKQTLSISQSAETIRLIKKCLPALPNDLQSDLKTALNR